MTNQEVKYAVEVRDAVLDVIFDQDDIKQIDLGEFLFGSLIGIMLAKEELSGSDTTVHDCLDILKKHFIKKKLTGLVPANI